MILVSLNDEMIGKAKYAISLRDTTKPAKPICMALKPRPTTTETVYCRRGHWPA
jgi:hypothetical protein